MISDVLLRLVEERINNKFKAAIVPFDKAYPTSGQDFIRLSANSLSLTDQGEAITCELQIVITCSTRIRTQAVQNQDVAYSRVIQLAENVFFWLYSFVELKGKMMQAIPYNNGVDGKWIVNYIDLRPVPVYADFYDSNEVHERQPAGMKIDITALMPRLWIPVPCGYLPEAMTAILDEAGTLIPNQG